MISLTPAGLLAYRPFIDPLPVWNVWYLTLIPLTVGIAVVYKSVKCNDVSAIPKQAATISLYILGGLLGAAVALWALVSWISR